MRSCFKGYWRFFKNAPDVLTPGRLYFVPDTTPHFPTPHHFGSAYWDEGNVPAPLNAPVLGHAVEKPVSWFAGTSPEDLIPSRVVGSADAIANGADFPSAPVELSFYADVRCFNAATDGLLKTFLEIPPDFCAWLRILARCLELLGEGDNTPIVTALRVIFGSSLTYSFDPGAANVPPIGIVQHPRFNIVFCYGTNGARLLAQQLWQGLQGPTNYGPYSTLPAHQEHALRVFQVAELAGADFDKPTLFAGHSLGGSASTICAVKTKLANPRRVVWLNTFGCPRPGDARLVSLSRTVSRFVHLHNVPDIVPQIPPSNISKAGLQLAFPFLPDAWFGTWIPFHQYLQMGPNASFDYGAPIDAGLAEYTAFVAGVMLRGQADPISAHFLPAYQQALTLRCPRQDLPFTQAVYDTLGLTTVADVSGDIAGGEGFELIDAEMEAVAGGQGELVTAVPGPDCPGAGVLPFGVEYSGTIASGTSDWWKFDALTGVDYTVTMHVLSGFLDVSAAWYGDCSALNFKAAVVDGDTAITFAFSDEVCKIQLNASLFGSVDYTIKVTF